MFWSKNKKNRYTPANPNFTIKVGFTGVFIARTCFPDEWKQAILIWKIGIRVSDRPIADLYKKKIPVINPPTSTTVTDVGLTSVCKRFHGYRICSVN